MRAAALALLALCGCSAAVQDEPCPVVVNRGWEFAFCGEREPGTFAIFSDEAWRVVDDIDAVLAALGLDLIEPNLHAGTYAHPAPRVEIYDQPDGSNLAGAFYGYHTNDPWRIHLYLHERVPRATARDTALDHELWHAYEANILSATRADVTFSETHFVYPETARAVLGAAASPEGCGFFDAYWGDE